MTVSGLTISRAERQSGQIPESQTQRMRSVHVSRGLFDRALQYANLMTQCEDFDVKHGARAATLGQSRG